MRSLVVSDLHLGTVSGRELLRSPEAREVLVDRVRGADHVVLLGDVLDLRQAPLAAVLAAAEPFFRELGAAVGSGCVTFVPGNHDHRLALSLIEARQLDGAGGALAVEQLAPAPADGALGVMAGWLGDAELRVAYPGVWLRPDVYATHGHYLDCHMTIPTLERLGIALTERAVGLARADLRTPDDYEAVVQPLYELVYGFAQASGGGRRAFGSGRSVAALRHYSRRGARRRLEARIVAGVLFPAAIGALNRAGLGPLTSDLSGPSLRGSTLTAMATVAERLGLGSAYVVFGHTHRSGPWPADDPSEWELRDGGQLVNTGAWTYERAFLGRNPAESPFWPGTIGVVEESGPPRLERALERLPATGSARSRA